MNKELKENIMQGTLQAFNQKGLKFTMDDIAKILGISKKTIYQAVSYTHLDVYKRQVWCSAIPGRIREIRK